MISFPKRPVLHWLRQTGFWGNRGYCRKKYENEKEDRIGLKVDPGQTLQIKELSGNKAITSLKFKIEGLTRTRFSSEILKDLWLSITWDNDENPSVLAPLGDVSSDQETRLILIVRCPLEWLEMSCIQTGLCHSPTKPIWNL